MAIARELEDVFNIVALYLDHESSPGDVVGYLADRSGTPTDDDEAEDEIAERYYLTVILHLVQLWGSHIEQLAHVLAESPQDVLLQMRRETLEDADA